MAGGRRSADCANLSAPENPVFPRPDFCMEASALSPIEKRPLKIFSLPFIRSIRQSLNRLLIPLAGIASTALLAACGTLPYKTVPEHLASIAELPSLPGVRNWGDEAPEDLSATLITLTEKLRRRFPDAVAARKPVILSHLAISGGGEDGAFGVGILDGWTAHGDRPEFQTVTGVSVGAIIAPFAFLGPAYNARIRELLLAVSPDSSATPEILTVLFGVSLVEKNPLAPLIERYVTAQMLTEIAGEYRKGRLLLIGTTNLNAGRPVIWNIGKLATSGHPRALDIFHKIILASSAIPGVFAPVLFDVDADGRQFQEVHVDGGVTAVVFLYPPHVRMGQITASLPFDQQLFIIRNRKLGADYHDGTIDLFSISERAISTLIGSQGNGDLYQIYLTTRRDGIDYNLISIPSSFSHRSENLFDRAYMRSLFEFGRDLGKNGVPWSKGPSGLEPTADGDR